MMEQRITYQNQAIEEKECFKLYTLVHLVQVPYTSEFTEQNECIRMHALSQE